MLYQTNQHSLSTVNPDKADATLVIKSSAPLCQALGFDETFFPYSEATSVIGEESRAKADATLVIEGFASLSKAPGVDETFIQDSEAILAIGEESRTKAGETLVTEGVASLCQAPGLDETLFSATEDAPAMGEASGPSSAKILDSKDATVVLAQVVPLRAAPLLPALPFGPPSKNDPHVPAAPLGPASKDEPHVPGASLVPADKIVFSPAGETSAPLVSFSKADGSADQATSACERPFSGRFSSLACPACQTKLKIDYIKLAVIESAQDLWLRCPACRDRFKLPAAQGLMDAEKLPAVQALPTVLPTAQTLPAAKALPVVKARPPAKTLVDLRPFPDSPLPRERREGASYRLGGAYPMSLADELAEAAPRGGHLRDRFLRALIWSSLVCLIVLATTGTVLLLAWSAPSTEAVAAWHPAPEASGGHAAPGYLRERLPQDLAALRRDFRRAPRLDAIVDYQGPAWRVYSYFSETWSPRSCQRWQTVRFWSLSGSGDCPAVGLSCNQGYYSKKIHL